MSPNRWKVLACAILLAAFSARDTANPSLITGAASPLPGPRLVIVMTAAQPVPPVVHTVSAPIIVPPTEADTLAVVTKAAQSALAVATIPPVRAAKLVAVKPAPVTNPSLAAANPPDVGNNAPVIAKNSPDTAASSGPPPGDGERPLAFVRRILAAHNRERQDLGLEPLSWNPALAQSAQRWAEHLAETGRFEHAPENHVVPEGENLWAGTKGYYTPEAMVAAWIREKRYFRTGVFPDNSTTGRVEDIGHYTQVVWRATHEVGCAEAASANEDILVCRYAEAGNYRGERPF